MRGVNKSRAKGSRTEKRDYPSPHSEALINWGRSRCQPSSDRAAGLSCSGAQHSIHWLFRNCVETESRAEPLIRSVRSHGQPLFCISPRCVPHFVAWLFDITLCYGLCEMRAPEHIQRPQVLWQVAVNHFAKLLLLRTDLWLLVDSAKNLLLQPRHVVHAVGSIYTCALVGAVCASLHLFFLHPNWCRWKILSTDLKPSGKSLWRFNQEQYKHWDLCEPFGSIPPQVGPKK